LVRLSNRAALAAVLGFGAVLAALLLLPGLLDRSGTAEGAAAALDRNPDIRQTIAALRTHYPDDHRALAERLAARARDGADQPALDRETAAFMQAFMAGKAGAVAAAPVAERRAIAAAYAALIQSLAVRDPAMCARFVTNAIPAEARPPRAILVRLDRIAALRIRAARAGEHSPRPPAAEDGDALLARVARADPESAALLGGGEIGRAPAAAQCRAALALYRAAAAAPR
jgi:hypothetical protein